VVEMKVELNDYPEWILISYILIQSVAVSKADVQKQFLQKIDNS